MMEDWTAEDWLDFWAGYYERDMPARKDAPDDV
jgi:hypothetical protein